MFKGNQHHAISKIELLQVQAALFAAIGLQLVTRFGGSELLPGAQYSIIGIEIALVVLIVLTVNRRGIASWNLYRSLAIILLGLISFANVSALGVVLHQLIISHTVFSGGQLLISAIAIFMTNIIVYALWYWEIDSPGLTRANWSKHDKDFQFTQQDLQKEFPEWHPQFMDYLYVSVTNAINFAPADTRPLTAQAKLLMATQALVSVFTIALVVARSVSILGS